MTHIILKYALDPVFGGQHAIPEGSRFLDLQVQDGVPTMWWSVPKGELPPAGDLSDSAKARRREWPLRTFSIVPTGGSGYITDTLTYMATFQISGFVGHVMSWEPIQQGVSDVRG